MLTQNINMKWRRLADESSECAVPSSQLARLGWAPAPAQRRGDRSSEREECAEHLNVRRVGSTLYIRAVRMRKIKINREWRHFAIAGDPPKVCWHTTYSPLEDGGRILTSEAKKKDFLVVKRDVSLPLGALVSFCVFLTPPIAKLCQFRSNMLDSNSIFIIFTVYVLYQRADDKSSG